MSGNFNQSLIPFIVEFTISQCSYNEMEVTQYSYNVSAIAGFCIQFSDDNGISMKMVDKYVNASAILSNNRLYAEITSSDPYNAFNDLAIYLSGHNLTVR